MPIWLLGLLKPSNFTGIFKFIARNWKFALIGAMVFGIWYQNFSSVRFVFGIDTIPALHKDITELEEQLHVCISGNALLASTIDKRNEEIEKWERVSDEFARRMKELEGDLVRVRTETDNEVAGILTQQAPQDCESAIQYLRDGTEELQWNE